MQTRPDQMSMARHARLFELLRQENMALKIRSMPPAPRPNDRQAALRFRQAAERSLIGWSARL